jgi:hypothetical protein
VLGAGLLAAGTAWVLALLRSSRMAVAR